MSGGSPYAPRRIEAPLRKLLTQFGAIAAVTPPPHPPPGCCSSTCSCSSCLVTTAVFSLATSRYLYVKTKAYNARQDARPVSAPLLAVYGLLFNGPPIVAAIEIGDFFGGNAALAVLALHFVAAIAIFRRVGIRFYVPILIVVGFVISIIIEMIVSMYATGFLR